MTALSSQPVPSLEPALLSRALEVAGRLANDAADVITATAGRDVRPETDESPFDWVTDTGRTLERHTRRVLAAEFPGVPVIGEESGAGKLPVAASTEYRWVVDPVDGTINYVAGIPWCSFSLALIDRFGPVVGVVADPYRAQIYAAARGRGTRANGTPVRLAPRADRADLAGGVICTELSRGGIWPGMAEFTERAGRARVAVRVLGSTALAIAQVALGHAVGAVLHDYEEWDVAGALALAAEAGAVVLDRDGHPRSLPEGGLLVSAPEFAADLLSWWRTEPQPRR